MKLLLIPSRNLAYVINGKAGSSTVKHVIGRLYGYSEESLSWSNKERLHRWSRKKLKWCKLEKLPEHYRKFMVVRNPFARVVSFYCDKVQHPHKSSITRKYGTDNAHFSTLSFEEFVFDCLPRGMERDIHTKLQSRIRNQADPHYIIKCEELSDQLPELLDFHEDIPVLRKTHHKPYREIYTPRTRRRVAELYEADLRNFDYVF